MGFITYFWVDCSPGRAKGNTSFAFNVRFHIAIFFSSSRKFGSSGYIDGNLYKDNLTLNRLEDKSKTIIYSNLIELSLSGI